MKRLSGIFLWVFLITPTWGEVLPVEGGTVTVARMLSGLSEPWAISFLPGGAYLVTERGGRLLHVSGRKAQPVGGVPEVWDHGQGGLLDVVVARDFAQSREVFISFSEPRDTGAATALASARLSEDGARLEALRVLFRMREASREKVHFGSRIVEAQDGTLFLTIGERGAAPLAQQLDTHNGKLVRIARDGSVPPDNPFASGDLPEIWSFGHRNPQGAALDASGQLWVVEHGAKGGDEVNRIEPGLNYGWPEIAYGRNYSGTKIGSGTAREGMEHPAHYWDPSIAPSGMMIYSGDLFPDWRGDFFVGSLKFDMISRLRPSGTGVTEVERLFEGRYGRIRDIRQAPDGAIWFLSVTEGAAYRITPE